MKVFLSGATGFIGQRLALRLAEAGQEVHALYRSESKAAALNHPNIRLFKGDLLDEPSIRKAMEGCRQAYHVAAFAGVWARDESIIYRLNVEATLKIIDLACKAGIERVVVTSTAGILGPSTGGCVDEDTPVPSSFFTPYEASKAQMENELAKRQADAPEWVIVNPTRVFGPGELSESNGVTRMIKQYEEGRWHFVPGSGLQSGNYVYVEDVVDGHLLAMEKGKAGERYVLGGDNISYNELFHFVRKYTGKSFRLFHIPVWGMLAAAGLMVAWSRISGNAPLIVPDLVRKFNHQWRVSSEKAKSELGYSPRTAGEGISLTLQWIGQREG